MVLGSGGARGFAHVGAIEALTSRGYKVNAVSGSSMGAAVGGIFAANKLPEFAEWASKLNKGDSFRLMDFTISNQGFIKGTKIMAVLREIVGEQRIEDFAIPYTAVATDIHSHEEVWLEKGELFEVIRASSAIPTLITPAMIDGRLLVDGGVLNPLPIEPVLKHKNDLVVVVNINGKPLFNEDRNAPVQAEPEIEQVNSQTYKEAIISNVRKWFNLRATKNSTKQDEALGYLGLLNKSIDLMQDKLCERAIEVYKPDIVVNISRQAISTFELHRANDLMDTGREATMKALDDFERRAK